MDDENRLSKVIRIVSVGCQDREVQAMDTYSMDAGNIEVLAHFVSGNEAIEKCPALQPDIVIIDASTPGMVDMEVLRILKEIPGFDAKIIMMSVSNAVDWMREALLLGAVHFLSKPLHKDDFLDTLAAIIGNEQ